MTSTDIQARLTEIHAELSAKQLRLSEIPAEKIRALANDKQLVSLEREETELSVAIERLSKRLPLLQQSLEAAQKEEAEARLRVIQQAWGASAEKVTGGGIDIRHALERVLALVEKAQEARGDYERLGAESRWLELRYGLSRVPHPPVDLFTGDELRRFATAATERLQRLAPEALAWTQRIEAWQDEQRRLAAEAERARPRPPIMTDRSGPALQVALEEERRKELAKFGVARSPMARTRQGFPPEP